MVGTRPEVLGGPSGRAADATADSLVPALPEQRTLTIQSRGVGTARNLLRVRHHVTPPRTRLHLLGAPTEPGLTARSYRRWAAAASRDGYLATWARTSESPTARQMTMAAAAAIVPLIIALAADSMPWPPGDPLFAAAAGHSGVLVSCPCQSECANQAGPRCQHRPSSASSRPGRDTSGRKSLTRSTARSAPRWQPPAPRRSAPRARTDRPPAAPASPRPPAPRLRPRASAPSPAAHSPPQDGERRQERAREQRQHIVWRARPRPSGTP